MHQSLCLVINDDKKVGAKLQSNLVIFSMLSSDIPLYFHNSIRVVSLKYLMYFLAGKNTI